LHSAPRLLSIQPYVLSLIKLNLKSARSQEEPRKNKPSMFYSSLQQTTVSRPLHYFTSALRGYQKWVWRSCVSVLMLLLLSACSLGFAPDHQVVEQALAIQVGQVQDELSRQIRKAEGWDDFSISHVAITEKTPLEIDDLPGYQIHGTYDYTLKAPKREVSRTKNPFEIYLQRQKENKTWRLARLITDEEGKTIWVTQRLPFAGE